MPATIGTITDLSPTAREVTLHLPELLGFTPGAFVNVFMDHDGTRMRRAYSISSDETAQDMIALSIRKGSVGGMSERFWDTGVAEVPLQIMGPLGLNTADKITGTRVFLFAFGIGVSVIKGLLPHLLRRRDITHITVMTGSRNEEEALYKEFFEEAARRDPRLTVTMVLSKPHDTAYPYKGHLQDAIGGIDFTDASVYICGTKAAAESLQTAITKKGQPVHQFLIEAFD